MVATHVTVDEFEATQSLDRAELIDGEIVELTPAPDGSSSTSARIIFLLGLHVYPNNLGRVYSPDGGFVLFPDRETVRVPDVAFVWAERMPQGRRAGTSRAWRQTWSWKCSRPPTGQATSCPRWRCTRRQECRSSGWSIPKRRPSPCWRRTRLPSPCTPAIRSEAVMCCPISRSPSPTSLGRRPSQETLLLSPESNENANRSWCECPHQVG
jgi:hypothetical protein